MLPLVVDSSVVVKWFVQETFSAESRAILHAYQSSDVDLHVPDLVYSEVGNVLWKKHLYQGMEVADAETALMALRQVDFTVTPSHQLLATAFQIATQHQRTDYDSLDVALALREQCRFVTADHRLVNAVNAAIPAVIHLAEWVAM